MEESTSWRTRAPTATTDSLNGGSTSGQRCATTRVELAHQDQSLSGGPIPVAAPRRDRRYRARDRRRSRYPRWSADHDGYSMLHPPARHRRTVQLDRRTRRIDIWDRIDTVGHHPVRLSFHLGPSVSADLGEDEAVLRWPGRSEIGEARATLHLPDRLRWTMHRGEADPPLGWYSDRFGVKEPTTTLLGEGNCHGKDLELRSSIQF